MDNEQLLHILQRKIEAGEISHEEVLKRLNTTKVAEQSEHSSSGLSITKLFYMIGAAIVIVGIAIFVGQIWEDIGSIGRIFVTLGLGLLLAGIGSTLMTQKNSLGAIFHVLGGALIPGGAIVTLTELTSNDVDIWPVALTFLLIFIFYLVLSLYHKHVVPTFFAIVNGTAAIYLIFYALVEHVEHDLTESLLVFLTIIVGTVYLLLARTFRNNWNSPLYNVLCFFGSIYILGAAFTRVFAFEVWQVFFFVFVGASLFLSIFMKSKWILTVSTLFLIAHISFITSKYFADSIGWPLALVILGFVFIGLGYGSIRIGKKYIS